MVFCLRYLNTNLYKYKFDDICKMLEIGRDVQIDRQRERDRDRDRDRDKERERERERWRKKVIDKYREMEKERDILSIYQ